MVFGGGGALIDGSNFQASSLDGVNVIGANSSRLPAPIVHSPFIGVAGPGFGLGVAGPGSGFFDRGVIARSNRTDGTSAGLNSGTGVGGATVNIVMGGFSRNIAPAGSVSVGGAGGGGNMRIGVGGAALSGGRR